MIPTIPMGYFWPVYRPPYQQPPRWATCQLPGRPQGPSSVNGCTVCASYLLPPNSFQIPVCRLEAPRPKGMPGFLASLRLSYHIPGKSSVKISSQIRKNFEKLLFNQILSVLFVHFAKGRCYAFIIAFPHGKSIQKLVFVEPVAWFTIFSRFRWFLGAGLSRQSPPRSGAPDGGGRGSPRWSRGW